MCIIRIRRELSASLEEAHLRWSLSLPREPNQLGGHIVGLPILLDPPTRPDTFDGFARYRVQQEFRQFLQQENLHFEDVDE